MLCREKRTLVIALWACALLLLGPAQNLSAQSGAVTIRSVSVLGHQPGNFELEIASTQTITPQTRVLTGPDRIVVDFPGALPGPALRDISVRSAEVKGIRVGLFENSPPVTRVVLDLTSPQPFQIFPSGRNVIVKLMTPGAATSASAPPPPPPAPPRPVNQLEVQCHSGNLKIIATRVSLAAVLGEIHRCTGAEIAVPPEAQREEVVANLGPAPARQVLASLLNGSPYNFIVVGSDRDPNSLRKVMLSVRGPGGPSAPATIQPAPAPAVAETAPEPPPDLAPDVPPASDASFNTPDASSPDNAAPAPDNAPPPDGAAPPSDTPANQNVYPPPPQ